MWTDKVQAYLAVVPDTSVVVERFAAELLRQFDMVVAMVLTSHLQQI